MFCAECGAKNENGAQFCEACGAKIENREQPQKTVVQREKKPMSKQSKMIVAIVCVVAVILIGVYLFIGHLLSPKKIAEDFFKATTGYDAEAIYSYLNVADSGFTSKKVFKNIIERQIDDEDVPTVVNYTVGKERISDDKMSATVTITYMLKDEDSSDTMDIKLVKDKKKKWLLFDNWRVSVKDMDTVKGYQIKVMKGSKVTVEGIEVNSKYLDKDESTNSMDVYAMPAMFNTKYQISIELPIGVVIDDMMNVNSYSYYRCDLSVSDLSDESKNALIKASKDSLQALYNGAKDKKTFDEIKSSFAYNGADLSDLQSDYESLVSSITTGLTSITFKDITLSSLDIESDGTLELYLKATYDYSLTYESGEETKTHDDNDYDYMYLTFDYVDGNYKLVDTSSLVTYFSKY